MVSNLYQGYLCHIMLKYILTDLLLKTLNTKQTLIFLGEVTLPSGWPRRGDIEFHQVSLRYDVTLHPVIKEVSLKVTHGQKVWALSLRHTVKSPLEPIQL